MLHDIIEDVDGYTAYTLKNMFNSRVAELVTLVTKIQNVDYKNPENLENYLTIILEDKDAAAIKTSDRMHNMMTLEEKTFEAHYKKGNRN